MNLAFDICTLLVTKSVASAFGGSADWACFAENEPTSPIKCITVYQSQAVPQYNLNKIVSYFVTFQVRNRGNTYIESLTRANLISSAIGFLLNETINAENYRDIIQSSPPLKIETDQKNKIIHVQNFSCMYKLT
jgi:hypothetical protein